MTLTIDAALLTIKAKDMLMKAAMPGPGELSVEACAAYGLNLLADHPPRERRRVIQEVTMNHNQRILTELQHADLSGFTKDECEQHRQTLAEVKQEHADFIRQYEKEFGPLRKDPT